MPPKPATDINTAATSLMQNPQFMALFQKAMGSDPIPPEGDPARETWLKKMQENLEKQNEEEMKKQLETPVTDEEGQWMHIMPEPGFCIKCTTNPTREKPEKEKVFINLVKHPRLAEPMPMDEAEVKDIDPEMKDAVRFRIPLSCSSSRLDTDKTGKECRVYDVVVNPLTIQRCSDDNEFRRFVAAISMSWIQQKHEKNLNAEQFTNVNFKCKGKPQIQRIHLVRPNQINKNNNNIENKNAMNNDIQLPKTAASATVPVAAAGTSKKMVQEVDPSTVQEKSESSSSSASEQQKQQQPKKPNPPSFIVAKVGSYGWSNHQKPTKNPYFHETVPEELCAEIILETVTSVKEVDVRIHSNCKQLELRWIDDVDDDEDCEPFLVITFDFPVQDEPLSAKFSKKAKTLTLRFKVVLPDEVELEERRSRENKAEREKEESVENAKKEKEQKEMDARRAKYERMQKEEQDIMAQRKEYVEDLQAVQQGVIPPTLREEIEKMPPEQAKIFLMRLEGKVRNNDGIDEMLDKMPEDVLFNVCNCIREKLGLELKKREEPAVVAATKTNNSNNNNKLGNNNNSNNDDDDDAPLQREEYNFAKKAENLFGVKMYNRYVFALDH